MTVARVDVKSIASGIGGVAVGLLIAFAGALIGRGDTTAGEVAAGTITVIGITVAFLSVFLLVLPPLLPSR